MALFDDLTVLLKYRNDPRNAAQLQQARNQLDRARGGISQFTKSALSVGAAIGGIGLTLGIAGRAIWQFGQESIDVFKRIETGMSTIEGLVGISSEQLQAWVPDMQAIRKETGRTMGELTAGLYDVTSAGLRGDVAMETLRISAMGSAAGMGETRVIADLLTSAINAWGPAALSAAQAGDDLAKAVELGKLPADALAGSMGSLIPIASAMGLEFGEMAGLMAAMSRTGTNAETAAVQLGQVLSLLLKPGKEAQKTLAEFGFTADELRDRVAQEGLLPVLQDLKDAFGDNEEQIAKVFPNIRALRGVFDLLGPNLAANVAIINDMNNSTGKLGEAFSEVTDDVEFAEAIFQASTENMMAQIGELTAPAKVRALEKIGQVFDQIADATRRAVEARQEFRDLQTFRERVETGDRTGPLQMFEGLDARAQDTLMDEVQRRSIDEGVPMMTAAMQVAVERDQDRLARGEITEAQFLGRIDRMAAEAGGAGALAAALEGAAEVQPALASELMAGRAAGALDPTETAQAISEAFPIMPREAMRPEDMAMAFARTQAVAAARAGMEGESAGQFDAAVQSAEQAATFVEYPRRPVTGLDEQFMREALVFARRHPEQAGRAQMDLVEFAATNPVEATTVLMEADLPSLTFDRMMDQLSTVVTPEQQAAGVEAAGVPEIQKEAAVDAGRRARGEQDLPADTMPAGFSDASVGDLLGTPQFDVPAAEAAPAAEPAAPAPAAGAAPPAEPADAAEDATLEAPSGAQAGPETPTGALTPPEAEGGAVGAGAPEEPPGFSEASPTELLAPETAAPELPPQPPEEDRPGLVRRGLRAAGRLLGITPRDDLEAAQANKWEPTADADTAAEAEAFRSTLVPAEQPAMEPPSVTVGAPESPTVSVASPELDEIYGRETVGPGMDALMAAAAGPPAPVVAGGDTIEGATTTTTTHTTTVNAEIIINGATDPQATAAAVREELSKETQAAVRAADPGVVR